MILIVLLPSKHSCNLLERSAFCQSNDFLPLLCLTGEP